MYLKLETEPEEDFKVFAISFAGEIHRLAWLLNIALDIKLERAERHIIIHKGQALEYEMLESKCSETGMTYTLFDNNPTGKVLLNEFRAFDFVLKISPCDADAAAEIAGLLKIPGDIRAVMNVESGKLKNKNNLITE